MPSTENPFPGMNPFLEDFWPDVHTRLMVYLSDALQPQLPPGLFARVEESLTIDAEDETRRRTFRADVLVAHIWSEETASAEGAGIAVAEPDVYRVVESATPRRVEIIDLRRGGEVVTVIEVLSPSNRGDHASLYRAKRELCLGAGVNLVEIDLLRTGEHVVALPRDHIPSSKLTPYIVCATRGDEPTLFRAWHIPLLQRLPAIAIPLRPGDRDAVVDLQPLLDAACRDGRYDRVIDYRKPLNPPLPPEALAIAAEQVRATEGA